MPALLEQVQCNRCLGHYPRREMSATPGICLGCFDAYYTYCDGCGALLARPLRSRVTNYCSRCRYTEASIWKATPLPVSIATYTRVGSRRKYGVEIETARCHNHNALRGRTNFGAKPDCSVTGLEFDSPVLYGDEGFDAIAALLDFADEHRWRVDSECGCHIHLDMRAETDAQLAAVAYAYRVTTRLWQQFVPRRRHEGAYCHTPRWSACDLREEFEQGTWCFRDFAEYLTDTRYEMVNLLAYYDHHTFEIRSLEGTLDKDTICNWVTCHCRFVDAVRDLSFDEIDALFSGSLHEQFDALETLLGPGAPLAWLKDRWQEFAPVTYEETPNANA